MRDIDSYDDIVKIYIDIESEGAVDFKNKRIYYIGVKTSKGVVLITDENEESMLKRFNDTMLNIAKKLEKNNQRFIVVGHNILGYDIPHIISRSELYSIDSVFKPISKGGKHYTFHMNGFLTGKYAIKGGDIVDTLQLTVAYDTVRSVLPTKSLKDTAIHFGGKKRLELSFDEILDSWKTDKPKLEKYLKYDLDDTERIASELIPPYWEMKRVSDMSLTSICTSTTAQIIEKMIEKYYTMKGVAYDNHPKPDEVYRNPGGLCYVDPGLYTKCYKLDVSSLYPSIMLRYGYGTRKDPDGYFLTVLKYLKEERIKCKKIKDTDSKAAAIDQAYKVLINSFYGFLGSQYAKYNDMKSAAKITSTGQAIMERMIKTITENNGKAVECDTDGIIYIHEDHKTLFEIVQKAMPDGIDLELEFEDAQWAYLPKKKNYMVKLKDGKVIKKGNFKKRSLLPLQSKFTLDLCEARIKSKDEPENVYKKYLEAVENGSIDAKLLRITRSVSISEKSIIKDMGVKPGDYVSYIYGVDDKCNPIYAKNGPYHVARYKEEVKDAYRDFILTVDKIDLKEKISKNDNTMFEETSNEETSNEEINIDELLKDVE